MKDLLILLAHRLTTVAKLLGAGGARAVVADSLLMKQQLLVVNRSRRRAPNLSIVLAENSYHTLSGRQPFIMMMQTTDFRKLHDLSKSRWLHRSRFRAIHPQ